MSAKHRKLVEELIEVWSTPHHEGIREGGRTGLDRVLKVMREAVDTYGEDLDLAKLARLLVDTGTAAGVMSKMVLELLDGLEVSGET